MSSKIQTWWRNADRVGWRNFLIAIGALSFALLLALYSAAMAQSGRTFFAAATAIIALLIAAWVSFAIVPKMARRTSLRWLLYQIDYRLTREGIVYLIAVFVLVLAAVNTGNNLLFMVLACLLAGIVISGILSRVVLTGLHLDIALPEHVFAEQPILASVEVRNEKSVMPSFSLRVVGTDKNNGSQILTRPVYFPYIPHEDSARQKVELLFPRRGVYRQNAFGIRTKFPFGFLEKTRHVDSETELVVYPPVEPTDEFYEVLPLISGEIESFHRGRGHDLYSIRDYVPSDSVRVVDWKASAKRGSLMVREFAREDERRLILALDPCVAGPKNDPTNAAAGTVQKVLAEKKGKSDPRTSDLRTSDPGTGDEARFERAVSLAACIAWHFFQAHAVMQFRTPKFSTPLAASEEIIYEVLRELAYIEPDPASESRAAGAEFLQSLAQQTDCFKIVLTSRPRGSIPTPLWSSSYLVFLDAL